MAAASSVSSLADALHRWNIGTQDASSWRTRILSSKTNPPPVASGPEALHDPANREQFLESLRQRQLAAEARVSQLREAVLEPPAAAAAAAHSSDEEDDTAADGESEESEDSDEDEEEGDYENELEYYVGQLLCVEAISHDPPSQYRAQHAGKEGACPYCTSGKKFESELACSTCAFVRGVCASCRKVVVLRSLEDPTKGAAVCLALLSDPALLRSTLDLEAGEDDEEIEAVQGQLTFMLDAYFDKSS